VSPDERSLFNDPDLDLADLLARLYSAFDKFIVLGDLPL
jgi:hypothetical protein